VFIKVLEGGSKRFINYSPLLVKMSLDNSKEGIRNLTNDVYKDIIFGSRKKYEAFLKLLKDYKMGYMSQEQHRSIVKTVDGLTNEMFYALRNSHIFHKLLRNWFIEIQYRKKLRQNEDVGYFVRMAESYSRGGV